MADSLPRQNTFASMADVARVAGVHQTTVSRALRNDPRISDSVKDRVQKASAKLGYRPNPLLSVLGTLRRQRAKSIYQTPIAYIMRAGIGHGILDDHLVGAQQATEQRGFKLETFVIDSDLHEDRLDAILLARNIQGIIVGPLPEAHGRFVLDWDRFCTVVIEYSFTRPAFDRVVTDSYNSMNMAIAECLRRGYSRLGMVLAKIVDERNEGLLSAAYALNRERNDGLANIPGLSLEKWNEKLFASWIRRWKPEVIISSNTLLPAISSYLNHKHIAVPDAIGLLNLNAHPEGMYSGVCQDAPAIGASAARLLIEKLNHNEFGIPKNRTTLLTEGRWLDGQTLR